ncbi:ferroportin-like [Carettochelys insculpta]|uniref:ferroportin-like n=1 Tax=Carettochelys insculpta TaxID=44489 RepID=UPI003EBF7100
MVTFYSHLTPMTAQQAKQKRIRHYTVSQVKDAVLSYLTGPRFLVYASCALSIWGDRMWHFAMSVFLIELYGHNLLLTAVFGLVVAGSVLLLGALIGDWIDRKPRNKVAHASVFIQNSSVTACCVVLMFVFSYKTEMEQMWHGWLTVFCYAVVIFLADVANLASTALTITIQKDWIVVITGDNRGQLAGMNATIRRMDQVINIFAPLSVGQVMTWASNVIGCGFILGWNLISFLVEFIFLSRVYQLVPPLAVKPRQYVGEYVRERHTELTNVPGSLNPDSSPRKRLRGWSRFAWLSKMYSLLATPTQYCKNSSLNHETLQKNQLHIYPFQRNINQPILPDRSSIHWTNNTVLLDSVHSGDHPESYISIILLFSGVILARIGLWSFDLTVTQLLQENIPESERGIVNGVQSSMNYLMDLVHFIMVILAPQPQQFGLLVIISLLFVITGHIMYFIYAKKYKIKETVIQNTSERQPQNPSV